MGPVCTVHSLYTTQTAACTVHIRTLYSALSIQYTVYSVQWKGHTVQTIVILWHNGTLMEAVLDYLGTHQVTWDTGAINKLCQSIQCMELLGGPRE